MPSWNQVLDEINNEKQGARFALDNVRRKYLKELSQYTGRATISYYSSWLTSNQNSPHTRIIDDDKNGLMASIHNLDRSNGLDLILHTPGGDIAAAESIVDYLRQMFGTDIRAIIPQISMSAGTMIACACRQIIMGKQSNLGPIDPQLGGVSAEGVISEFKKAIKECEANPHAIPMWGAIISKYHPTFIEDCEHAIEWSKEMVVEWLKTGMFSGNATAESVSTGIVNKLSSHGDTKAHNRHVPARACKDMGLKVVFMENMLKKEDSTGSFQDLVLTIHHTYMHTFGEVPSVAKIIENNLGIGMVKFSKEQG